MWTYWIPVLLKPILVTVMACLSSSTPEHQLADLTLLQQLYLKWQLAGLTLLQSNHPQAMTLLVRHRQEYKHPRKDAKNEQTAQSRGISKEDDERRYGRSGEGQKTEAWLRRIKAGVVYRQSVRRERMKEIESLRDKHNGDDESIHGCCILPSYASYVSIVWTTASYACITWTAHTKQLKTESEDDS